MLPFMIPRLFRPMMLESWGITNTDVGAAFSAYGFSAMVSYILGGHFADKYSPRALMSLSLLVTALLGLMLIATPSATLLITTYFFFGISTILLMWAALLKVTHVVGGEERRSFAMGILDSGRGFIAAVVSSVLVYAVTEYFTTDDGEAISVVYMITTAFTLFIALAIWILLKNFEVQDAKLPEWSLDKAKALAKDSKIWLLGIVILSAYCGYKSVDNYSVYLVDVLNVSSVESSKFTSIIFWLRPLSALFSGYLVDKIHARFPGGRFMGLGILLFMSALLQIVLATNAVSFFHLVFLIILFSAAFAYALRSIYFSVFGDLNIPENLVGTTVGIVSLVGFLPDMFFGAFTGYLIDSFPGVPGYTYVYTFTGVVLIIGTIASFLLYKGSKES